MTQTRLSVPEIHCDHCKASIESAVSALEGVEEAVVDVPSATVTIAYGEPAGLDAIVAAIEEQGYEVPPQG